MGARFENFAIGRAVAKLLNIKDPKNFPTSINTDELQPVLSIGGIPPIYLVEGTSGNVAIGGFAVTTIPLLNPLGAGANTVLFTDLSFDYLVDDISVNFTTDAAGAIAMNGKNIILTLDKATIGGQFHSCYNDIAAFQVTTGFTSYVWTLRFNAGAKAGAGVPRGAASNRPIIVTRGRTFQLSIAREDGANFAANTQIMVTVEAYHDNGMGTLRP